MSTKAETVENGPKEMPSTWVQGIAEGNKYLPFHAAGVSIFLLQKMLEEKRSVKGIRALDSDGYVFTEKQERSLFENLMEHSHVAYGVPASLNGKPKEGEDPSRSEKRKIRRTKYGRATIEMTQSLCSTLNATAEYLIEKPRLPHRLLQAFANVAVGVISGPEMKGELEKFKHAAAKHAREAFAKDTTGAHYTSPEYTAAQSELHQVLRDKLQKALERDSVYKGLGKRRDEVIAALVGAYVANY